MKKLNILVIVMLLISVIFFAISFELNNFRKNLSDKETDQEMEDFANGDNPYDTGVSQ